MMLLPNQTSMGQRRQSVNGIKLELKKYFIPLARFVWVFSSISKLEDIGSNTRIVLNNIIIFSWLDNCADTLKICEFHIDYYILSVQSFT